MPDLFWGYPIISRLSYAEADVRTGDGRLVAHGTSTLMRLPGLGMKLGIPLWAE